VPLGRGAAGRKIVDLDGITIVFRHSPFLQGMSIVVYFDDERKIVLDIIILVDLCTQSEPHQRWPFDPSQLHVGKIARNRGRLLVATFVHEFGELKISFYP
jgi:hypothetical protein